jgi:hypothetical protein
MTTLNRPNRITLDAYSDATLKNTGGNGVYSSFTNNFTTPVLNAKAIQLLNANIINSSLQLNDYSLMFFYRYGVSNSFRCVRLHPASFVPYAGYTAFVKNKYWNDVDELVAALNTAATAGGDDGTFNTLWEAGTIQFAYDEATRRITISNPSGLTISPVAADDPQVLTPLSIPTNKTIAMNAFNGDNTIAGATPQPRRAGFTMNARLGFAMSYYNRGLWWTSSSTIGNASSIGVPATSVEADAYPILLGTQNVNVYLDIVNGSGMDTQNRKNLAGTIPIEFAPLNINNYTFSSLQAELMSVPSEIYGVNVLLLDDNGAPFPQPPNFNTQLSIAVFY